jgi:hypothetical protein
MWNNYSFCYRSAQLCLHRLHWSCLCNMLHIRCTVMKQRTGRYPQGGLWKIVRYVSFPSVGAKVLIITNFCWHFVLLQQKYNRISVSAQVIFKTKRNAFRFIINGWLFGKRKTSYTVDLLPRNSLKHIFTYGAEPFLRSSQLCSHSGTSQHFKEPAGSSPCPQEPSTGPYPEQYDLLR